MCPPPRAPRSSFSPSPTWPTWTRCTSTLSRGILRSSSGPSPTRPVLMTCGRACRRCRMRTRPPSTATSAARSTRRTSSSSHSCFARRYGWPRAPFTKPTSPSFSRAALASSPMGRPRTRARNGFPLVGGRRSCGYRSCRDSRGCPRRSPTTGRRGRTCGNRRSRTGPRCRQATPNRSRASSGAACCVVCGPTASWLLSPTLSRPSWASTTWSPRRSISRRASTTRPIRPPSFLCSRRARIR
mmetsp:Transcript_18459/g.55660  ORF Transcript_18459/g.55660 Transcript_18459/m.55660 type:complete len:242 (+) Transcript_18459:469-1194(+)